jgi:hypothetical protein
MALDWQAGAAVSVHGVAGHGTAEKGQVDADLVCASGNGMDF